MATYNGVQYLPQQIESIISQLGLDDELVVVDDFSTDGTLEYLKSISTDSRIKIYNNSENKGIVHTFNMAIELAGGQIILMADQDDVWVEGRLQYICKSLNNYVMLVSSNSKFINSDGEIIESLHPPLYESDSSNFFNNIIKIMTGHAYYDGCTMGFRREFRRVILPFPKYVESHDLWIAMAANMLGSNFHLENITLYRRIHGRNASVIARPLLKKIFSRLIFVTSFFHIFIRIIKCRMCI
jgi:glycosyltransferase involved in cell wall biosynthesis